MTKRRSPSSGNTLITSPVRRVDFSDAIDQMSDRSIYFPDEFSPTNSLQSLQELSDGRLWYPTAYPTSYAPARTLFSARARLAMPKAAPAQSSRLRRQPGYFSPVVAFEAPREVVHCIRRKQRREVLLALGRGGGRHRKPTRNQYSGVSCR